MIRENIIWSRLGTTLIPEVRGILVQLLTVHQFLLSVLLGLFGAVGRPLGVLGDVLVEQHLQVLLPGTALVYLVLQLGKLLNQIKYA